MRRLRLFSLVAAFVLGMVSVGLAGKFNKVLDIGSAAPSYQGLIGTDDKTHSLADLKDKKAVVIVFTTNHCPVAIACEDRIIELQKEYGPKGVQVVAINVNTGPEDGLDKMKERAQEKGFNFPYLFDPTQQVGRDFDAKVTPQFFVLDQDRKVAYMGLMDDQPLGEEEIKAHYVRDVLDALLAGKAPATPETKAQGCGIRYAPKAASK